MFKYEEIVKSMRQKDNYIQIINNEDDIVKKCILCKKYLSSNQWSLILEKHIKKIFNIQKAKDSCSGDGYSINNKNIEIKVSLGSNNGTISFVQIRPDHKLDYYLFLVYDLYKNNLGNIHWLLCNTKELYELLPEFGGYSISQYNKITLNNIYNRNLEYVFRPSILKNNSKSYKLWCIMQQKFEKKQEEIYKILTE